MSTLMDNIMKALVPLSRVATRIKLIPRRAVYNLLLFWNPGLVNVVLFTLIKLFLQCRSHSSYFIHGFSFQIGPAKFLIRG